jgi:hypothetical protein
MRQPCQTGSSLIPGFAESFNPPRDVVNVTSIGPETRLLHGG